MLPTKLITYPVGNKQAALSISTRDGKTLSRQFIVNTVRFEQSQADKDGPQYLVHFSPSFLTSSFASKFRTNASNASRVSR